MLETVGHGLKSSLDRKADEPQCLDRASTMGFAGYQPERLGARI